MDLLEGQSRPITWEHLQIVDKDNIDAVTLIAMDGPLNGHLSVRGKPIPSHDLLSANPLSHFFSIHLVSIVEETYVLHGFANQV